MFCEEAELGIETIAVIVEGPHEKFGGSLAPSDSFDCLANHPSVVLHCTPCAQLCLCRLCGSLPGMFPFFGKSCLLIASLEI